jgi:Mrp family chromosome partitioning ATPase/capsular polysaccharide biosynthesis protein
MQRSTGRSDQPQASWFERRPQAAELSRYVAALRAHIAVIVAFLAAGVVGALVYIALAPKSYTAEADLLVTPVSADDPNLMGLPLIRGTSDPTADVLTVAKLVTSQSVASLVSGQLGGSPSALSQSISATPVTQSQIIAVQAAAPSPGRAAALANAFAQQTVQERTGAMHAQLASLIPSLQISMHRLTPDERASLANRLAVLETLRVSPDPTLRVSSPAAVPSSPASPNRELSLAAGGFAGLVIGLLAVLALHALDPKLRDEEQLREIYDLPLIARVPRQRAGRSPLTPQELEPPVAEAFRMLRSAFTVGRANEPGGHAILVTGDTAANGKTTVALNLAAALVAARKQVIVIESDLRRPSIGKALRVTAPRGIADVLLDRVELLDALIWTHQHGPELELLLATTAGAQDLDQISPESGVQLVRQARALCDFVIVDSPPLTDVSDALPFADEVDDVLLVARVGNSHERKLADMGELLARRGIKPAGLVLVGGAEPRSSYYYRYGQGVPGVWGLVDRRTSDDHFAEQNGASVH